MSDAKVWVVVPDEADVRDGVMSIKCVIESMICHVAQSFGPHAQYKGRNVPIDFEVKPISALLDVRVPVEDEAEPATDLSSFVFNVLNRCVAGVEFAVIAAEEREVERQKELREFAVEAARQAKVTQKL